MTSRPLTDAEVALVLKSLYNERDRCLFLLGIKTGFRISELLSLTVTDIVDTDSTVRNSLTVRRCNMKGSQRSRTVPLHQEAISALKEYVKSFGLVNCSNRDSYSVKLFPISRIQAYRVIRDAARRVGLKGVVSTHSMRKSFGMKIYDRTDKNIVAVQRALGHASLASTTKYLSVGQDIIDKAILGD